ncbi:MAG: CHAT domain-containing tetratricopeptide repeat protein [Rhodocyclales bacterium]|nr:CHAT domain-containing tetratricopeptide repeat protein [Rhodocyclales bacterium]
MNLGVALCNQDDLPGAVRACESALTIYHDLITAGSNQYRADLAQTKMNLGIALGELGDLQGAVHAYEGALTVYRTLIAAGSDQYRANAAITEMNLGVALGDIGDQRGAIRAYEGALTVYRSLIATGNDQYRSIAAMAEMNLGHALADQGDLSRAIRKYESALTVYRSLITAGNDNYRANAAKAEMNMGNALSGQGDQPGAIRAYENALMLYRSLIATGNDQYRADAAATEMNIGIALSDQGNQSKAIRAYMGALAVYHSLIASGKDQYRAYAAHTEMNLGVALYDQSNQSEAIHAYERALAIYHSLIASGKDQYRANAAHTEMNLGVALSAQGNQSGAIRAYEGALVAYNRLIASGKDQYSENTAKVSVNLGIALAAQSKLSEALNRLESAVLIYIRLAYNGAWQHDNLLHTALHACCRYSLQQLSTFFSESKDTELDTFALRHHTLPVLSHIQRQTEQLLGREAGSDSKRFNVLQSALASLLTWQREQTKWPSPLPTIEEATRSLALAALSTAHQLLIEGNPVFVVQRYEADLAPLLYKLLNMVAAQGWIQHIASWYFATQGLRAQRQSLLQAQTVDPEIAQLLNVYQQLDSLLHQMLGVMQAEGGQEASDSRIGTPRAHASKPNAQQVASLQAKYDEVFQQQLKPLKESLKNQGKYPETPPLDLDIARTCLARQTVATQILMLIPLGKHETGELLVVRVGAKATEDALWRVPVNAGLIHLSSNWQGLERYARLQARTARGVASWRDANLKDAAPKIGDEEVVSADDAVDLLTQCLDFPKLLLPFLQPIAAAGIQCVHILPAGDAHLAPWAATLDQAIPGLSVRQFPSAGGWWRAMEGTEETGSPAAPTAWASLAYDAVGTPLELRWVAPEAQAVQSIWQAASVQMLDPLAPNWPTDSNRDAAPVTALACIGHGQAPEGNLALAGLALPKTGAQGGERLFTAMQLHQIRHAERLVMSCCVLGRIEDAQGEPLGMTALALSFKTRFAVGAMLPIPDFAGSLFFMALHHAWAKAERAALSAGEHMDWAKVFHATRRCIMQGNWPLDYGDWLRTEWLRLLHEMRQEDHTLNTERLRWLDMQHQNGEEAFVQEQAQAPSEEVRWVAAVTSCLG